jgi:hypothetical protein
MTTLDNDENKRDNTGMKNKDNDYINEHPDYYGENVLPEFQIKEID